MIDKGDYWYDEEMVPTINRDDEGNIISWHYCPYLPKSLFPEMPEHYDPDKDVDPEWVIDIDVA